LGVVDHAACSNFSFASAVPNDNLEKAFRHRYPDFRPNNEVLSEAA
jgi:hypothetical protein